MCQRHIRNTWIIHVASQIKEQFYDRQNRISARVISDRNLIAAESLEIPVKSRLSRTRERKLPTKCNAEDQCCCSQAIGAWQREGRGLHARMPASGEYRESRYQPCVISVLVSRRQTSAITQPRDPANMSAHVRSRCARTARKTALAPARLLLYNNYRLIKICYLTLR